MALALADFMLTDEIQTAFITEIGGLTGDVLPGDLRERYADVVPTSIPTFPDGDWGAVVSDG